MLTMSKTAMLVADEVWTATALLHRQHPGQSDFSEAEILDRALSLGFTRPGVKVHINQHCVANRHPNPGRYRMLFETAPGRRRLYRTGDPYDPGRAGAKITPKPEDLPTAWRDLLDWHKSWKRSDAAQADPLMALWGRGRTLWADEPADQYVERMRGDWA